MKIQELLFSLASVLTVVSASMPAQYPPPIPSLRFASALELSRSAQIPEFSLADDKESVNEKVFAGINTYERIKKGLTELQRILDLGEVVLAERLEIVAAMLRLVLIREQLAEYGESVNIPFGDITREYHDSIAADKELSAEARRFLELDDDLRERLAESKARLAKAEKAYEGLLLSIEAISKDFSIKSPVLSQL